MRRSIVAILAGVFLAAMVAGCGGKPQASTVKVGVVGPMTGSNAIDGKYMKQGIDLAVEEYKDGVNVGGVKYKVEVFVEDDEGKPETGANAFRKLVDQNKVFAIIGPTFSKIALAGAPIANSAKVITIATMATNPKVTEVGEYVFRSAFIDPFQGQVMAKFAREKLGLSKVAILHNNADDYAKGLTGIFKETFEKLGGTVVAVEAYGGADIKDFNPQLVKIKAAQPEAIYLPNQFPEVALQAQQARKMDITVPLLGSDSWDAPDLVKLAGDAIEGSYITALFSKDSPDPKVAAFVKRFQQKYNDAPNSNATAAYDATKMLLQAIEKAGKLDAKAVRDALATQSFEGSCGTIKVDQNRNPSRPAFIMKYTGGKLAYEDIIQP